MTSAEKLKILREKRNLSQAEVAKALGLDRTTYVKYERGGSIKRNVLALARFFHVSTDYLLNNETPASIETTNSGVIGSIGGDNHGNITANFPPPAPASAAANIAEEVKNFTATLKKLSPEAIQIIKATLKEK